MSEPVQILITADISVYQLFLSHTASGPSSCTSFFFFNFIFLLFAMLPWIEGPAEALAHHTASGKFKTNPIKETHGDESDGGKVARCISAEITVLCRT